MDRKRLY